MWPNTQETADLVTFTGGILNEKLHFFCGEGCNVPEPKKCSVVFQNRISSPKTFTIKLEKTSKKFNEIGE